MDEDDDSTMILNMKRDYKKFLSRDHGKKRLRSERTSELLGTKLDFDISSNSNNSSLNFSKSAEEINSSTKIIILENELSHLKKRMEEQNIKYEQQLNTLRSELQKEKDSHSRVRHTLRSEMNKRETIEEEYAVSLNKFASTESYYKDRLSQAEDRQIDDVEATAEREYLTSNELLALKNDNSNLSAELLDFQLKFENLQLKFSQREKKCADLESELSEKNILNKELQDSKKEINNLKAELESYGENAMIVKVMRCKLEKFPELERENRTLKDENKNLKDARQNAILLKEEIGSVKLKLEKAEFKSRELDRLEVKYEEAQNLLQKYEVSVSPGKYIKSVPDMKATIHDLQNEVLLLSSKNGEISINMNSFQRELNESVKEKKSLANQVQTLQQNYDKQVLQINRLQKRLLLISKERESLKQVLYSYQSEVTMNMESVALERIHQLESNLEQHESHIKELEELIATKPTKFENSQTLLQVKSVVPVANNHVDKELILQLRTQISTLEKQLEESHEKVEILEARMERVNMQGDYDPTKVRVLHFQKNPMEIAMQKRALELEKLREENKRLKERIKVLEESDSIRNITLQVEEKLQQPSLEEELNNVQKELESANVKYKRVMEAFKKTSEEFRTLVLELVGYRIDIISSGRYKLMNIYSESPDDCLMFERNSNGDINMLSSDFAETISDKIHLYLNTNDSYPALLSDVTLYLFNKQTIIASDQSYLQN